MAGMTRRIKLGASIALGLGLAALLNPLASVAGGPLASVAAERDTLTIGVSTYPPTLNPLIDATVAKSYVLGFATRPLTAYDKDWRPICLLCTALPTLENGKAVREDRPDGKHGIAVTFTLQPAAR